MKRYPQDYFLTHKELSLYHNIYLNIATIQAFAEIITIRYTARSGNTELKSRTSRFSTILWFCKMISQARSVCYNLHQRCSVTIHMNFSYSVEVFGLQILPIFCHFMAAQLPIWSFQFTFPILIYKYFYNQFLLVDFS